MTWTSTLALSAASSLAAAALTALYFRSRLNAARASANLFKEWWLRDSGKMLVLQAEADLRHQQHVDAGRKAHEPAKVLRAETTEKLIQCLASRDFGSTQPLAFPEPAMGSPADLSAGRKSCGSGSNPMTPTGRGRGISQPTPGVAPNRQFGRRSCPENRAAESASAETTPEAKGA